MSDHVSALDATFLELEEADETAHMHIGAILVFDPLPAGGVPSLDAVRAHLDDRLGLLPRYRQRLSSIHTGGLAWPHWEDDPDFDIERHVRRAALPAPGGARELCEWAAEYWSHRLDRRHPLWEAVLVEGLEDGRWALCTKTHHCMVDGVGSVDAGYLMLDSSPKGGTIPPQPQAPEPAHSGLSETVRAVTDAALHPRSLLHRSHALASLIYHEEVLAAPPASINHPIGKGRRFAVVRTRLRDLKAIRDALGGTVNDVVLAVVAGGLRSLLEQRGDDLPAEGLRAMVPVNIRQAGDRLALGNKITSLFVPLPVAESTPMARYARAKHGAESLKSGSQAVGGETLISVTSHAPPVLHSMLARSLYASRLFNVTVTNVPGSPRPLYALGSRLREVSGLVPLAADHAVGVAILSYAGEVTFGVIADRDSVPDIDVLTDGIEASLAEYKRLAAARRRATRRRSAGSRQPAAKERMR